MKRKLLIVLLVLTLVLPSFTIFAKNNDKGENLNLAPYVDFEVKEKEKVDVIIDIGNASYTEQEINSLINTTLRPQLTAKGLDYNIIVKDTNEGIDHVYFGTSQSGIYSNGQLTNERPARIYKYDFNTKQYSEVPNVYDRVVAFGFWEQRNSYYDPQQQLLINFYGDYVIDLKTRTNFNMPRDIYSGSYYYFGDGSVIRTFGYYNNSETLAHTKLVKSSSDYIYTNVSNYPASSGDYNNLYVTPKKEIFYTRYSTSGNNSYTYLYKIKDINQQIDTSDRRMRLGNLTGHSQSSIYPLNEYQIVHLKRLSTTSAFRYSIPYIYDLRDGSIVEVEEAIGLDYDLKNLDYMTTDFKYVAVRNNAVLIAEDALSPFQQVSTAPNSNSKLVLLQVIGDYAIIATDGLNGSLYSFNLLTYEWVHIKDIYGYDNRDGGFITNAAARTAIFKYPVDYNPKKYLVKDVINEQNHRYDADVYYVRIDDYLSNQFAYANDAVDIANLMNTNNMTFLGIAGSEAKASHDNMLQMLDYNGKTILNTNIEQSLQQVTTFILNKKNVELHVLDSKNSSFTAQNIQQTVNQIKSELRADNYVVKTHYLTATSNTLAELLDYVSWNDYSNTYVLFLNNSALTDIADEEAYSYLASQMNQHYAHFIGYGNAGNKAKRQAILELMNNRGYLSETAQLATFKQQVKQYIIDTAESNSKRHINKLVLKHNPVTNEYSSEIELNAYYFDHEHDPEVAERYKTEHDPTVYENHTGLMANTGVYLNSAITRFTKVGKYEIVAQKRDDPTRKAAFNEYSLWSEDSLSRLVLYVHRQPVAEFQAYFNAQNSFVLNDLSYDLDHYSKHAKGLMKWDWKYKRTTDTDWTIGKPSNLNPNYEYIISLKVQDIDEAWSKEVMKVVGKNLKPVAYFEVEPTKASWTTNPIITDRSYSPSALAITERHWKVYREGRLLIDTKTQPTVAQIKQATTNVFSNPIGLYEVELRVKDSANQYSEPYSTTFQLINYEPIPLFEIPQPLYRDDLLKIDNLTGNKDLDGEVVTFNWTFKKDNRTFTRTDEHPQFIIKDLGLGKAAVGKWEVTLSAKDTLQKEGKLTKQYVVSNHAPTSDIIGDDIAYLDEVKTYNGQPYDLDSEDRDSLKSYWKVTKPSGEVQTGYNENISVSFKQKGKYTMEHWVVDQLDESSPIYTKVVTVLNKPPVADFTINPNPTYRFEDVDFKSLAYDEDGYITSYRYTAENEQGITSLLSTENDFVRSFSSVGEVKITHTVTDNNGHIASVTKSLIVQNRKPTVQITSPVSLSPKTPSIIQQHSPNFNWIYFDEDLDEQREVELIMTNINASSKAIVLKHLGSTTSMYNVSLKLEDGQTYKAIARAFDGYDWGEWSEPVYFTVKLNSPPNAGFTYSPKQLYEGDEMHIYHQVADENKDELLIQYEIVEEAGKKVVFPAVDAYYTVTANQYNSFAFTYKSELAQSITIEQIVTDGKSNPVKSKRTVKFNPLTLEADVRHTSQWENYRQQYNNQGHLIQWDEKQFYAGEKFMLIAHTTLFDYESTDTKVYPIRVEAYFPYLQKKIMLERVALSSSFAGEYYEAKLDELKNGYYTFDFFVYYSNGVIKSETVQVEMIGKAISFVGVHRMK